MKSDKDRGAVLIATLLIMAIMAALTVALMDDIRLSIKRTANVSDYAQADWYVRGAEDYVADVLAQRLQSVPPEGRNQVLATINPILLPIDDGIMQMTVRDGSHCFNLGSLSTAQGLPNKAAGQQFLNILDALGVPLSQAESLSAVLTDWVDADSQASPGGAEDGDYLRRSPAVLPANTPLASVMEIRAVKGMTPKLYEALRPWLCIGEPYVATKFNIDLAEPWQAPLLAGLIGGADNLSLAKQLIADRPEQGYRDMQTLLANPLLQDLPQREDSPDITNLLQSSIIFTPQSLWVELELSYRKAQRSRSFLFSGIGVDNGQPILTYRGWGRESFRPYLRPVDATTASEGR